MLDVHGRGGGEVVLRCAGSTSLTSKSSNTLFRDASLLLLAVVGHWASEGKQQSRFSAFELSASSGSMPSMSDGVVNCGAGRLLPAP